MKRKIKNKEDYLLYGLLIIAAAILIFSIVSFLNSQSNTSNQHLTEMHSISQMSLTSFDKQLAGKLMDKNNDGLCDACGMNVDACIDSGQLQCNMDPKSTIGIVGSTHIHADWKIYINGKTLGEDFFVPFAEAHETAMKDINVKTTSSFIHIHEAEISGEKPGDVLHVHATGVPLWLFFESIGARLNKTCLALNEITYCNDKKNTLKFYVNGKLNDEYENYVLNDLDKILISYGNETDLSEQLRSITDFAKEH